MEWECCGSGASRSTGRLYYQKKGERMMSRQNKNQNRCPSHTFPFESHYQHSLVTIPHCSYFKILCIRMCTCLYFQFGPKKKKKAMNKGMGLRVIQTWFIACLYPIWLRNIRHVIENSRFSVFSQVKWSCLLYWTWTFFMFYDYPEYLKHIVTILE